MSNPTCRVDSCDQPIRVKSRELCTLHYTRWLRHGDENAVQRIRVKAGKHCSTDGCKAAPKSRGMCRKHYRMVLMAERPACSIGGCESSSENAGMCGMHYARKQRGQDARLPRRWTPSDGSVCRTQGCTRNASSKGYCKSHYNYKRLTGQEPATVKPCFLCGDDMVLAPDGERLVTAARLICHDCRVTTRGGRWCMTVEEIRDRDGSDCYICGDAVDFNLKRPDLMCPSVEHVVPRALGGLDRPSNVALAHLICNLKKGATPITA